MKCEGIIVNDLNYLIAAWAVKFPSYTNACVVIYAKRRVLVIIVRITMNSLIEKRTEVTQTLLSMIEPTENGRGCLSCHVLRDIENKNVFREMLYD